MQAGWGQKYVVLKVCQSILTCISVYDPLVLGLGTQQLSCSGAGHLSLSMAPTDKLGSSSCTTAWRRDTRWDLSLGH